MEQRTEVILLAEVRAQREREVKIREIAATIDNPEAAAGLIEYADVIGARVQRLGERLEALHVAASLVDELAADIAAGIADTRSRIARLCAKLEPREET